jgi:hypothetical protein
MRKLIFWLHILSEHLFAPMECTRVGPEVARRSSGEQWSKLNLQPHATPSSSLEAKRLRCTPVFSHAFPSAILRFPVRLGDNRGFEDDKQRTSHPQTWSARS